MAGFVDMLRKALFGEPQSSVPATAPAVPGLRGRYGMDEEGNFMPPAQNINVRSPSFSPPAPPPKESLGQGFMRGLTTFAGNEPEGGFRGTFSEGVGDTFRAIFGYGSGEETVAAKEKMRAERAKVQREQALSEAIASGDLDSIAAIDPEAAAKVVALQDSRGDLTEEQAMREAIASGDLDAIAKINPVAANAMKVATEQRDAVRREAASRAVALAEKSADFGATIAQIAAETPNLFTEQELQAAASGPQGMKAILGATVPGVGSRFIGENGNVQLIREDGSVTDTGIKEYRDPLQTQLTQAQIDNYRSSAANRGKSGAEGGEFDIVALRTAKRAIGDIRGLLSDAKRSGAITTEENTPLGNVLSGDNPVGRYFGKLTGSKEETARTKIDVAAGNLLGALLEISPKMSARLFDTPVEKQAIMDTLGTSGTYESRLSGIDFFDRRISSRLSPEEVAQLTGETAEERAGLGAPVGSGPPVIRTKEEFDALPSGAVFTAPNGVRKVKP